MVVGAVGPTPPKKPPPSAVGFNKVNRRVRAMIKRGVELGLTDQLEQTIRGWLESDATEVPAPMGLVYCSPACSAPLPPLEP